MSKIAFSADYMEPGARSNREIVMVQSRELFPAIEAIRQNPALNWSFYDEN